VVEQIDNIGLHSSADSPTVLLVLDGFGYAAVREGNAIAQANMPVWKKLVKNYPHTLLRAAGQAVGLPSEFIGNSEVGHVCLGAGRIVRTSFCRFHDSVKSGSFFKNAFLIKKFRALKKQNRALHVMGIASDAGVHGHIDHFYAVLRLAKQVGLTKVFIHAFLDGRDVPPRSAKKYLQDIEDFCRRNGLGRLASIHGRFYAMDRDNNWDRIEKSYRVMCGDQSALPVCEWHRIIDDSYKQDITDEFVLPTLLCADGAINPGDGVFCTNFRPDRAQHICEPFLNPNFDRFPREPFEGLTSTSGQLSFFISAISYNKRFKAFDNDVLFAKQEIAHTLLDVIAEQGKALKNHQVFIIAETEKYAHVTYFFRGSVDVQFSHEERVLIPSLKARSFVNYPGMSAKAITQKIVDSLEHAPAFFYLVNYANCDMVGHSGDMKATVSACEEIDRQLAVLYEEVVIKRNGTIFLTADHGNAEEMLLAGEQGPKTSHTNNPVPFMVINKDLQGEYPSFEEQQAEIQSGLSNVAATILHHLGLAIPDEMNRRVTFSIINPKG